MTLYQTRKTIRNKSPEKIITVYAEIASTHITDV